MVGEREATLAGGVIRHTKNEKLVRRVLSIKAEKAKVEEAEAVRVEEEKHGK